MATFTHGSGARVLLNGYEITTYLNQAGVGSACDTSETTAFQDTDKTYIAGLKEGSFNGAGMFDSTASPPASDQILESSLGDDGSEISYYPEGYANGKFGYGIQGIETSYELSSPVDGVNALSVEAQSCEGAERIVSHVPLSAISASGTASSIDNAAATSAGFCAYLHVTARNGGTIALKYQDSANDSDWDDLTGATFTSVTAGTISERIQGTANPRRYVRAVYTLTGTGTITFQTGFGRVQ